MRMIKTEHWIQRREVGTWCPLSCATLGSSLHGSDPQSSPLSGPPWQGCWEAPLRKPSEHTGLDSREGAGRVISWSQGVYWGVCLGLTRAATFRLVFLTAEHLMGSHMVLDAPQRGGCGWSAPSLDGPSTRDLPVLPSWVGGSSGSRGGLCPEGPRHCHGASLGPGLRGRPLVAGSVSGLRCLARHVGRRRPPWPSLSSAWGQKGR